MGKKYYNFYKIINKINNKIYVGRTEKSIRDRFKNHISSSKNDPAAYFLPLYHAFRKYGINNFEIQHLYTFFCKNTDEANNIETYLINKNNAFYPNGYNVLGLSGILLKKYRYDYKCLVYKGIDYES